MQRLGIISLDVVRLVTIPSQQFVEPIPADPGQDSGIGDLKAVEMKDGQDGAIRDRVEKLIRMPRRSQGARLSLAIADYAGYDESGVVESGAKGMAKRIAQFAT